MHQTIEAITDQQGNIHLLEKVKLPPSARILVTVLDHEVQTEQQDWSAFSLQNAVEGMDDEVFYALDDVKESIE